MEHIFKEQCYENIITKMIAFAPQEQQQQQNFTNKIICMQTINFQADMPKIGKKHFRSSTHV